MKKNVHVLAVVFFAIIFLVSSFSSAFAQENKIQNINLKKPCCIAGNYEGFHKDIPSKTCHDSRKGEFKMVIKQDRNCGSNIWGTITDEAGEVMKFKGTVKAGPGKCCSFTVETGKPGEPIKASAILCRNGKKWESKKGTYVDSRGCKGEFEIKQVDLHILTR